MKINIPDNIMQALELLEGAGFEAYAVGGCVRDSLLGKTPYDWDICTSAMPEETMAVFTSFRTVPTGIKHGTVTVIIDEPIEITTFRIDGEYIDNRRPIEVEFTRNLKNDLCRRDFTVNAMALDKSGKITDLYGGKADLEKKTIRCVGDAPKRFDEDTLRIMRALRFAATLGFEIEEKTAKAIFEKKDLLKNIAVERIRVETDKLLLGCCAEILLNFKDVFAVFMPEIEITQETAKRIESAPVEIEIRLAVLLSMLDVKSAENLLKRMKYSSSVSNAVIKLLENKDMNIAPFKPCVKRLLNRWGAEDGKRIVRFLCTQGKLSFNDYTAVMTVIDGIFISGECFTLSQLAINGSDLSALEIKQKQIGLTLNYLLEKVMDGTENTKENLTRLAKEYKQSF